MCFRPPSRSNAPGRACAALALALLAGAAHPGAAAAQAASDARSEVERFERVLDAAVASVSQPRVLPLLGGAGGARGFLVPGVGVVFVLPPQALPGPRRALCCGGALAVPMPPPSRRPCPPTTQGLAV